MEPWTLATCKRLSSIEALMALNEASHLVARSFRAVPLCVAVCALGGSKGAAQQLTDVGISFGRETDATAAVVAVLLSNEHTTGRYRRTSYTRYRYIIMKKV